jgi:hypothetical protein
MALVWDLTDIANADEVCWLEAPEDMPMQGISKGDVVMNPVTNALIWATMTVDLPGITRENAPEFYTRLRFVERLDGPMLIRAEVDGKRPEGEAAFITMREIVAHIGLKANVSQKTRSAWLSRFSHDLNRDADKMRRMLTDLEQEVVNG